MTEAGGERRGHKRAGKGAGPRKKARKGGASRRGKRTDGQRRALLIKAIAHPLRRRILRRMADDDGPFSPVQLSKALHVPVGTAAYHSAVLAKCGAVKPAGERQVRGAVEHFYETTIENDPPIEALLEETRTADDKDG